MLFEQIATGGCQSYLIGCRDKCVAALIDPEISQLDRYQGLLAQHGMRLRYVIDTHTHADHFSASHHLGQTLGVPVVMHHLSPAPFADLRLDDGDTLIIGNLRLQALHTPGHTRDSMCLLLEDRLFTGDTLLIGGTGRTDLPTGDAEALYDSLFNRILKLDPALKVFPAHDYKGLGSSTIAQELANNPRLQKRDRAEFVDMMQHLNIVAPTHLTEALRTNMSGGKTVQQMLSDATQKYPSCRWRNFMDVWRRVCPGWWCWMYAKKRLIWPGTFPAHATCRVASWNYASMMSCRTRPCGC